ncbi:MAG: hypothetical protein WA130_21935 [Candidatus Methanoperedens sp.]
MGEYVLVTTTERNEKTGIPRRPGKPDEIPGVGLYASFIDTEGNRVRMLEPLPMQSESDD